MQRFKNQSGSSFGKQLKRGDRYGTSACLVLGNAEAENQTVNLKWLTFHKQRFDLNRFG